MRSLCSPIRADLAKKHSQGTRTVASGRPCCSKMAPASTSEPGSRRAPPGLRRAPAVLDAGRPRRRSRRTPASPPAAAAAAVAYDELKARCDAAGQQQVLEDWEGLSPEEQAALAKDVEARFRGRDPLGRGRRAARRGAAR
jgi:hypothetical protein